MNSCLSRGYTPSVIITKNNLSKHFICLKCVHWNGFAIGCRAFNKIKHKIILTSRHDKPLKVQNNDFFYCDVELLSCYNRI